MFWVEGLPIIPTLASHSHLGFKSGGIASPMESSQSTMTIDVSDIAIMSRIYSNLGTVLAGAGRSFGAG